MKKKENRNTNRLLNMLIVTTGLLAVLVFLSFMYLFSSQSTQLSIDAKEVIIGVVLICLLIYTVLMSRYRVGQYRKGELQMFNQYKSYRSMLEIMKISVVEYDVEEDKVKANDFFMEKYAENEPKDVPITMSRLKEIHPEFNYFELDDAIAFVLKANEPYAFETAISLSDGKIYWIEIRLMPQSDLNGRITTILATIVDTTKFHEREDNEEVISNIPNGIHRCYLSQPIHMEFASKGMCDMLGYSEKELDEKITPNRKLTNIIHPDDREYFVNFVRKAAKSEGRYTCEYRLQRKDGCFISVLDVMEVKRSASGTMYGYSSVTDITDLQRAEELANERLRAAEEEIEKHISIERKIIEEKEKAEERFQKEALELLEKSRITQEEANKLVRAISSINSDYSAIYFVDLDKDEYQLCRSSDLYRKDVYELVRNKDCFSIIMNEYVNRFVQQKDQPRMLAETKIDAIKERFLEVNQYFVRYQLKENSYGQVHYEMHIVNCSNEVNEHKATVGFRCLDATIEEENKRRQEVENLENRLKNAQLKNSMSQMQPHFLYNALASIREIVLDDPQYASDLIYDFSTHLRACIRAMSNNTLVPFKQELENINAYINIEKMRFGEKLHTRFQIEEEDFYIVPLSIQPLVENAIRHGIYERGSIGGTVTISTYSTPNHHVVCISDDGVGFDYEQIRQETEENKRDSTGLTNLIFRLKKIMNAEVTVESTPGVGTKITVKIPKEDQNHENDRG